MDEQLYQLIVQVCQHPLKSPKRRKAMNLLLIEIQRLPELGKSSHPDYLDALNRTFEWVNRQLCQDFNPDQPLVQKRLLQWINSYLYWRIKDLDSQGKGDRSLDAPIGDGQSETSLLDLLPTTGFGIPTRSGLDGYIEQIEREQQQAIGLKLEQYVEQDPKEKLQNCHPQTHPNCNCQFLTARTLLKNPPDKFSAIAKEQAINYQTLKSHWERKCRPLLQEIALELGYKSEP